ncbi:metallophosphoesterase [Luteipulveratus mongoliensis]|uniref:Calcineurin-like phosphoesterase domain-containing protein n=1 Tax=Luteipulveratus mongoliensis TaxID=571913 RepID=A0A0K1JLG5_9MICO|nr:metallophosphoesterase [Luteipulveratus mongoliensis]AKU17418.1 hypothetical protein VV02_18830 [Luteipulveratus mongoliensis]
MTAAEHRTRVAVIGDVGGHLDELRAELIRLGADSASGALPADLIVVQVGDLVHRGPDSAGVVRLVDGYLNRQPEQWVQLAGNHEAQYLREPAFEWSEPLDKASARLLQQWWTSGLMRAAVALPTVDGDYLATHAGLTAGFWRDSLGQPSDARQAADLLNRLVDTDDDSLFRAGEMLGRPASTTAGPLWACAQTELLPSWMGERLPFNQIHGHTSLYDWHHERFRVGADLAQRTVLEPGSAHETTSLDGGHIVGIDPGHGRGPRQPWHAWVTELRPGSRSLPQSSGR